MGKPKITDKEYTRVLILDVKMEKSASAFRKDTPDLLCWHKGLQQL